MDRQDRREFWYSLQPHWIDGGPGWDQYEFPNGRWLTCTGNPDGRTTVTYYGEAGETIVTLDREELPQLVTAVMAMPAAGQ